MPRAAKPSKEEMDAMLTMGLATVFKDLSKLAYDILPYDKFRALMIDVGIDIGRAEKEAANATSS